MSTTRITLLVDDLPALVRAAAANSRQPALERIMSRGNFSRLAAPGADHLRFLLFGIESSGGLPIAALTHVTDREAQSAEDAYWLRTDPVTLWADMAAVVMRGQGFADLDPYERNEIENCIRTVLQDEGINLHGEHPERWCIALDKPLAFEFPPLQQALGADISTVLPDHPEARFWHRLMNEIQVALHHCPVNQRRRQRGQQEINSVWFWGGGFIPDAVPHDVFDTVYSNHPVSRGLALINDCRIKCKIEAEQNRFDDDGRTILIDWTLDSNDASLELQQLEWLAEPLVVAAGQGELELMLLDGQGNGWQFDRKARKRFWRRNKSLVDSLPGDSAT